MSFEKPMPKDVSDGNYMGRRQAGVEYMCSYCNKPVTPDEPAVTWDSVTIPISEFEAQLEPIARLAAQTNLSNWRQKYNYYIVDLVWHTHCAVCFGGHLLKDGLADNNVSHTLRNPQSRKTK